MRVIVSPASRRHPEWSCQRKLTIVGDWSRPIPLRLVILVGTAQWLRVEQQCSGSASCRVPFLGDRPRLGAIPVKPGQTKMKPSFNTSNRKLNVIPEPALTHHPWSNRVKPGQTKFSVTDPLNHYWVKAGKTTPSRLQTAPMASPDLPPRHPFSIDHSPSAYRPDSTIIRRSWALNPSACKSLSKLKCIR